MTQSINALYGAFELKRFYQKNMMIGTISVTMMAAAIMATIWIFAQAVPEVATPPPEPQPRDSTTIIIGDPYKIISDRPIEGNFIPPSPPRDYFDGRPVLIDNDTLEWKETIIDDPPDIYVEIIGNFPGGGGGDEGIGGYVGYENTGYYGSYIPPIDTFIPHELPPEPVNIVKPKYPGMARKAGFTAIVLVRAFVGTDGKVLEARIMRCSTPDIGFEEAALAAAYQCKYRPAIQNGTPVAIWIDYKVRFSLD